MSEAPARIEVRLMSLSQLFNSLDPSPFHERDLDHDAEEFIVSWARVLPRQVPLELIVHVREAPSRDPGATLEEAVRHYFRDHTELKEREFHLLVRRGRLNLVIGMAFLVGCFVVGTAVGRMGYETLGDGIKESLIIGGWVAMWKPLEFVLYDWWAARDELRLLRRLGEIRVRLDVVPSQ
ncbi:MAG: hypothetical protein Q8N18_22985 [Opitutaceae bacterium]|nr:hypothetical protein [Opitutaceae bacterium]